MQVETRQLLVVREDASGEFRQAADQNFQVNIHALYILLNMNVHICHIIISSSEQ